MNRDDDYTPEAMDRTVEVDYLALRRHISDQHPELYPGFRNDVLWAKHEATGCAWPED